MNKLTFVAAAFAVVLASTSVPSLAASSGPLATVRQALSDFNSGDYGAWARACAGSTDIIDDFAPYRWSGPGACNAWAAALRKNNAATNISNITVNAGVPSHMEVGGDTAYIVLPTTIHFNQNGKPVRHAGNVLAIVMRKMGNDWRMIAWSWADGK